MLMAVSGFAIPFGFRTLFSEINSSARLRSSWLQVLQICLQPRQLLELSVEEELSGN